jgi:hypothetical protein
VEALLADGISFACRTRTVKSRTVTNLNRSLREDASGQATVRADNVALNPAGYRGVDPSERIQICTLEVSNKVLPLTWIGNRILVVGTYGSASAWSSWPAIWWPMYLRAVASWSAFCPCDGRTAGDSERRLER